VRGYLAKIVAKKRILPPFPFTRSIPAALFTSLPFNPGHFRAAQAAAQQQLGRQGKDRFLRFKEFDNPRGILGQVAEARGAHGSILAIFVDMLAQRSVDRAPALDPAFAAAGVMQHRERREQGPQGDRGTCPRSRYPGFPR
jgi:hypothetical protein